MLICAIDGGYKNYDYEIERFGADNFIFSPDITLDPDEKIKLARNADGLLVRGSRIDGPVLDRLPKVKAIVRYGVGYDNIDLEACSARGIRVANVQGYANHSVSDHALALMYACQRALFLAPQTLLNDFSNPPRMDIFEFRYSTLGIVGLGRIGGTLASKTVGLFSRVIACDPYIPKERFRTLGVEEADFDELLANSHVISLHCNLTDETRNMISADAFAKMAKRPILINTARGPVIDQSALVRALDDDLVHSAGVDVYATEPPGPKQEVLLNHPRVICTGHYAWYSEAASAEVQKRAADNLYQMLQGKIPEDCLNP